MVSLPDILINAHQKGKIAITLQISQKEEYSNNCNFLAINLMAQLHNKSTKRDVLKPSDQLVNVLILWAELINHVEIVKFLLAGLVQLISSSASQTLEVQSKSGYARKKNYLAVQVHPTSTNKRWEAYFYNRRKKKKKRSDHSKFC